ncbi:MAG TPA: 50S ribosomal protein L20, partial [Patescibacteria group bacterium]|nr:50S ribosomal protein L20 [Patescibacteria group bacterium]
MTRVKRGTISRSRHKSLLSRTKGFRMTKSRLIKVATEADLHAGQYAFAGRKRRKRDMRRLWITRISEAVKQQNLSYSRFVHALKEKNIQLDRKILSLLIRDYPDTFSK